MADPRQVDAYLALLTDTRTTPADVAAAARAGDISTAQAAVLTQSTSTTTTRR